MICSIAKWIRQIYCKNPKIFVHFQAANYDFYETLEKICCNNLEHYKFPVFEPSTSDIRAALLTTSLASAKDKIQHKLTPRDTPLGRADIVAGMTSLSLALSLGNCYIF